jgi:periplasmic copper chaperone A
MNPNLARRARRRRTLLAALIGVAGLGLWASSASAHVTIENNEQAAGGFAVLHFQVPNESDSAATSKVEISLPEDAVIPFVLPRTTGDWKATVEKRTLATPVKGEDGEDISEVVSKVTFEGGSIPAGQFDLFDLELGPLPDTPGATLAFPAVQTYDNGDVVRWIDPVVAGQPEPEHPAPVLNLTAAAGDTAAPSGGGDSDSNGLAIVGIVLGSIGVLLGGGALILGLRRRA